MASITFRWPGHRGDSNPLRRRAVGEPSREAPGHQEKKDHPEAEHYAPQGRYDAGYHQAEAEGGDAYRPDHEDLVTYFELAT